MCKLDLATLNSQNKDVYDDDCTYKICPAQYHFLVPAIPAQLTYGTPGSRQDLDVLDAFSGQGEVTKAFRVEPWVLKW